MHFNNKKLIRFEIRNFINDICSICINVIIQLDKTLKQWHFMFPKFPSYQKKKNVTYSFRIKLQCELNILFEIENEIQKRTLISN